MVRPSFPGGHWMQSSALPTPLNGLYVAGGHGSHFVKSALEYEPSPHSASPYVVAGVFALPGHASAPVHS
mgnify:CR=1 FL=1